MIRRKALSKLFVLTAAKPPVSAANVRRPSCEYRCSAANADGVNPGSVGSMPISSSTPPLGVGKPSIAAEIAGFTVNPRGSTV